MKIAVGMSGGVDSSVSAAQLVRAGHSVTGVFLECWRAPGCRVDEDRKDALAVALALGIPFQVLDFKEEYRAKVVEYFFAEYEAGRTPNPDVLCNKEIKFGLFYDWARANGFDAIATGHYAQILPVSSEEQIAIRVEDPSRRSIGSQQLPSYSLCMSNDGKKDQTYFLYRLRSEQLSHILFPIGHLTKAEVRKLATAYKLPVAQKPDSQGICFIGDINVHQFLRERLGERRGEVVDVHDRVIGEHQGLWFYTIGQRHGFTIHTHPLYTVTTKHATPPLYVIDKDPTTNRLVVGAGVETLGTSFAIETPYWIAGSPPSDHRVCVRIRHGGDLFGATLSSAFDRVDLVTGAISGIAAGQSAVFYQGKHCLGGAVIANRSVTTTA